MAYNPPCSCPARVSYRCLLWCEPPQDTVCSCQLHWTFAAPVPLRPQGLGTGVCIGCSDYLSNSGLFTEEDQLRVLRDLLDYQSTTLNRQQRRSTTQEVEVHGNLLLSSGTDDRSGVHVTVYRPRGQENVAEHRVGTTDTTTVEYRVQPYDYSLQRWLNEGFRHRDRGFEWDNPDAYNSDPGVNIVDDEDEGGVADY